MIFGFKGNIGAGKNTVASIFKYCLSERKYNKWLKSGEATLPLTYTFKYYLGSRAELYFMANKGEGHCYHLGNFGMDFEDKMFAGMLKQMCAIVLNVNVDMFESEEFKRSILPQYLQVEGEELRSVRWLMQKVGTEAFRDTIHKDIWINALFDQYSKDKNWIITDVRFINEAKAITDRNGVVIDVRRLACEGKSKHVSETEVATVPADYEIGNNGTLDDLYIAVNMMIDQMIEDGILSAEIF